MNKKIVDEKCSCGHLKSEHSINIVAVGHGACGKCDCKQFTWVGFVFEK